MLSKIIGLGFCHTGSLNYVRLYAYTNRRAKKKPMKTLTFSNEDKMPAFGLGTWKSNPGIVKQAVITAIEIGYRHIHCAAIYGNESEVGDGIQHCISSGLVKREELWITSKLWNNSHHKDHVKPALEKNASGSSIGLPGSLFDALAYCI